MRRKNSQILKFHTGRQLTRIKNLADAIFNIGDALYKQNKFEEAGKQFIENQ